MFTFMFLIDNSEGFLKGLLYPLFIIISHSQFISLSFDTTFSPVKREEFLEKK